MNLRHKTAGMRDQSTTPDNQPVLHEKLWRLLGRVRKIDRSLIQRAFANHLEFTVGKNQFTIAERDIYLALAYSIRDLLLDRWNETQQTYYDQDAKRVYYLSMEFLMGRTLENSLFNMRALAVSKKALEELDYNLEEIIELEQDAGLGNGGLGRLAACFLDSMATLSLPGYGYGIRYDYGIFKQKILKGFQTEIPDMWLAGGYPWEVKRYDFSYTIRFYGHVESYRDQSGEEHFTWVEGDKVIARAFDTPIPGYNTQTVNNLRLWSAEPAQEFNFDFFNRGDYIKAVEEKINSENISAVLYPNDNVYAGKELRLKQQYLMISASLQDIIRRFLKSHDQWAVFPDKVAIQLNDTHPAMAIAEFMRILVDEKDLGWIEAWEITQKTFAYTNHTVLPEALERWSVSLVERLLPRHIQVIYEINRRWLERVREKFPNDEELVSRVSLIEEGPTRMVRMAFLAVVGSNTVNGVAALHSRLITETIFKDFYKICPEKFQNKTNGITQRRWLGMSNRSLAKLITRKIGKGWITDLYQLKKLERWAEDGDFQADWAKVKHANKVRLAKIILDTTGVQVDPTSMFDIQVKRIHEYKRQHLNLLHVISLYLRMKSNPNMTWTPRTVILAGKAAPGYYIAKLIIKLTHEIAEIINNDADTRHLLKVVFIPDYRVTLAERIIPACDLSEQISTAGTEASGTGNMKFSLNGALTIGTLDGANIEIMEEVGEENIYIFGLKTEEVVALRHKGYNPWDYYHKYSQIKSVFDFLQNSIKVQDNPNLFQPLIHTLLDGGDFFMVLADFNDYMAVQSEVSKEFRNSTQWWKKSILNSARMGKFSADRTIAEYARDIWKIPPVPVKAAETFHAF